MSESTMTTNSNIILFKHKWFLYSTEFFSGMSVMAVELGASRLIAPYFSSSQIVWTIIIGTIMIAMALGNVFGGRWADHEDNPGKLFRRILIAAIWIALIPVFGKYCILLVTGAMILTISTNLLVFAAFITCLLLFVFPLFLLGTVTPSLIRFSVNSLEESGSISGKLGAYNTIGSILGTFLPTFVTIPTVGTAMTFLLFSGILLFLSLLYFYMTRSGKKIFLFSIPIYLLACLFGRRSNFAFWEKNLTYEGESIYNYLQVRDTDQETILSTNVLFGVQSVYLKNSDLSGMYYDYALAAPLLLAKQNPKILVLGMGSGTYTTECKTFFPSAKIEGVEIDQKITDLAHTYFHLSKEVPVTTYDGRAFLNASQDQYDVIMVDAYQDITIPFQMSTREFFTLVKNHLTEEGVMVVNMNMHGNSQDDITTYLSETIASVFPEVATVEVSGSTNRELFAQASSAYGSLQNRILVGSRAYKERSSGSNVPADEEEFLVRMRKVGKDLKVVNGGNHILTDDRAPVELLGMKTIDRIIQEEAGSFRSSFRENGFSGLLGNL